MSNDQYCLFVHNFAYFSLFFWKAVFSKIYFNNPARKHTPPTVCPPQAEDSFYPQKMENPHHFLILWSQPKQNSRGMRRAPRLLRKWRTPFLHQRRIFSKFLPLVENPPCSLLLRRVLQKRSSVEIPFKES